MRGPQNLLLFSGNGSPRPTFLAASAGPASSTIRDFSTNNNNATSSIHRDGDQKSVAKDSPIDGSSTPSSGEVLTVKEPKPDAKGALANYYDTVFQLWTERSGTNEILALKESVNEAGAAFDQASATVTKSRRNLETALRAWERASGQHLQLLQRRESWTPEDAQRFADYVSLEITSRNELEQARHDLSRSEEILTKSQLDYINKMRRRYHEEQIWQDQWRVLGTYGTWGLIVLNSCVFLGSQVFQRRREKDRMESIERLIRENRSETISTQAAQQQAALVDPAEKEVPTKTVIVDDAAAERTAAIQQEAMPIVASMDETGKDTSSTATIEEQETMPMVPRTKLIDVRKTEINQLDRKENSNVESKDEPKHVAVENVGATVAIARRWEGILRSKAKAFVGSVHQKVRKVLPADIGKEMPTSVSDIHVPSAVIGASVGGIAALTIAMVISSLSNRR